MNAPPRLTWLRALILLAVSTAAVVFGATVLEEKAILPLVIVAGVACAVLFYLLDRGKS